jgi:subtilase family serine protease
MRPLFKLSLACTAAVAVSACSGGGTSSPATGSGSMLPQSQIVSRSPSETMSSGHFVLPSNVARACPDTHEFGYAHCTALVRTDVAPQISPNTPQGYGPPDLQSAYNLPSASKGSGETVAIVDAYDDPNAESDLGTYRSTYGLPACTTANGCFKKVNQEGQQGNYPTGNEGWALELSLDIDMVSAGCPNCNILLVEGNDSSFQALGASVDEAVKLGAHVVSNSYSGEGGTQSDYAHKGVVILASAGDDGYGIGEPAAYPSVVAVGGTTLTKGGSGRGWSETVWNGSGSGCTSFAKPAWQKKIGCSTRVANDVSADANPNTGVAVYDTYGYGGFIEVGGTSVSSPFLGSVYGLAQNASKQTYAKSLWETKNHKHLYDVTSGNNGSCNPSILCTAGPGWDGPTGWGTPNGVGAF